MKPLLRHSLCALLTVAIITAAPCRAQEPPRPQKAARETKWYQRAYHCHEDGSIFHPEHTYTLIVTDSVVILVDRSVDLSQPPKQTRTTNKYLEIYNQYNVAVLVLDTGEKLTIKKSGSDSLVASTGWMSRKYKTND